VDNDMTVFIVIEVVTLLAYRFESAISTEPYVNTPIVHMTADDSVHSVGSGWSLLALMLPWNSIDVDQDDVVVPRLCTLLPSVLHESSKKQREEQQIFGNRELHGRI